MFEPGRLMTAMVTPFTSDGRLDQPGIARLARHLVDTGTQTIVIAGTTGESPTLTHAEKLALLDTVLDTVGDRAPVMIGTGTNSTDSSIALTREAEQHGAHAVLLVAPYYNRPPQEGLFQHFSAIANSTSLPVMLYNIPSRTGVDILPATVVRLSEISNIFALKEASGHPERTTEILSGSRAGFRVYSGDDSLTLPILSLGGYGVVSVAAHLVGTEMLTMIDAFVAGNTEEAIQIQGRIGPLLKALFVVTNPIPLKAALQLAGLPGGKPRLPLVEATLDEQRVVRTAMQNLSLLA